ncbi:MAG: isoprenylcysteine carboxylmethyltransferase family protein [Candidatus Cloacimonetes bacterium]|nr:isoprenylcysteine carboxylmethyltransferase family protein [Candidatus Cloacimonadota bacterium]
MTLQEHLEKSGIWLFRWRSYLPIIVIGLILVAMYRFEYIGKSHKLDVYWELFCLLLCFIGLGVRIYTIGHIPKGTSGRNTKKQVADSLNTKGIYSIVRNPLYLGNFIIYAGVVLFAHSFWIALIYILIFWLYYERIIYAEESFLIRKFGAEYLEWAEQTPAFIPRFKNFQKSDLRFSLRNALKREYHGFFALVIVLFCLETAGDFFYLGRIDFDLGWILLVGISFLIWLILRKLKKHTKILDEPGR